MECSPLLPPSQHMTLAPSSSPVAQDPSVSERHAEIGWNGTAWTIRDLGSSNGTVVDGVKLAGGRNAVTAVIG